jgi:hypothetical protein
MPCKPFALFRFSGFPTEPVIRRRPTAGSSARRQLRQLLMIASANEALDEPQRAEALQLHRHLRLIAAQD